MTLVESARVQASALKLRSGYFNSGLVHGSTGRYPVFFAPALQILQECYRNKLIKSTIRKATTPTIVTIAVQD